MVGLALLPEAGDGVVEQQDEDDGQIRPMAHQERQQGGCLDHVGDGPGEEAQEFLQFADLFRDQLVAAVLFDPLLRLARRQALRRCAQARVDVSRLAFSRSAFGSAFPPVRES
jgi:hypothetical protein